MKLARNLRILMVCFSLTAACSDDSISNSDQPETLPNDMSLGLTLPQGLVIDDFSDCESEFKTQIDSYWYTFNDELNSGDSTSDMQRLSTGLLDDSCALT
ncbi:MAG: hypothetical protein ACOH5I_12735 [Oligoflexus sp.]